MDRYIKLKNALAHKTPVTMANLIHTKSPLLMEAYMDADCVLLDKEHGVYDTEGLIPLTTECRRLGLPTIVRAEDSVYHLIAKAIDLGADGIMIPRTESAEQVKTAVEAMNLYPHGRTGFGGFGILREGESIAGFNKSRILIVQIESENGLRAIPDMMARYGEFIDGFMIGPNDYSITLGVPRELDHPKMTAQIKEVFDVCKKYGKSFGCFAADAEHAKIYKEMGANIFWIGDDRTYISAGLCDFIRKIGL